ncbi:MAG: hypothetical protein NVS2B3_16100 [Vulcanimicrobiaceae bacterium]
MGALTRARLDSSLRSQRSTIFDMTTVVLGIALALTAQPGASASKTGASLQGIASAPAGSEPGVALLLDALNEARAARGLTPLVLDERLCAIARDHGRDMASRAYFDHRSPDGATPFDRLDRARYRYGYAGENLALDRDAAAAHRALFASPAHRANMLESHYARVGIAAVPSRAGELVVEDFSD